MTDATTTPASTVSTDATATATSESSPAIAAVTTSTQPSGSADTTVTTSSSDPWAGLTPENLAIVQNKKWSDPNAVLKSYVELERSYHAKTATVEVPADVAGYDFEAPAGLPEGFEYSADFENTFKTWAHEEKLSKKTAQGIRDKFVKFSMEAHAANAAARDNAIAQSKVTLVREWGPEEGPTFSRNVELATRAVEQLGMKEHLINTGAVIRGADGALTVVDAATVKAFSQVGQAMFAEDSLYGSASAANNPFAKDTENMTMAGRLAKENPQMARQLIKQAGREADFAYLLSKLPG